MSQHEKMAWWALVTGLLIWLFLLMRFTEAWLIVDLPPGRAMVTYVQMIVMWIVAAVVPAVLATRHPEATARDERDRAIEALGERWEGWVVVIAVNVLVLHALSNALFQGRTSSMPRLELVSMPGLVFALLTVLFLGDAVKRAVIVWHYRR
jgi:hypothetical protein